MEGAGGYRATRDNGLRCASYVPLADFDPRIADAMLDALRDHGIAAYAEPTPATTGGYLERQLPDRPIDRLWVDRAQLEQAQTVVDAERREERGPDDELDFEAAWQELLGSLQDTRTRTVRLATPAPKERMPGEYDADDDEAAYDPADDEHYVPPPAPPLPKPRRATAAALVAIGLGLLVLATDLDGGGFTLLAVAAIVGGVASLVWHMRQGPPTDSGWDDGAVV